MMRLQDILTDESKWCQGSYARNDLGEPVICDRATGFDATAVSFSLLGAIRKAGHTNYWLVNHVERHLNCGLQYWNDKPERTFAEVREHALGIDAMLDSMFADKVP